MVNPSLFLPWGWSWRHDAITKGDQKVEGMDEQDGWLIIGIEVDTMKREEDQERKEAREEPGTCQRSPEREGEPALQH